jgi:hypothetical protein
VSGTLPVSATALPLPTLAATSTNQATEIASLATIATAVSGTLPVSIASAAKKQTILYNSAFAASTSYDSGYIDTQTLGTTFVNVSVYFTGNSANPGLTVTTSPDSSNAGLVTTIYAPGGNFNSTLLTVPFTSRDRYYRIQFGTGSGQALTNLEIVTETSISLQSLPLNAIGYSTSIQPVTGGAPAPLVANTSGFLAVAFESYEDVPLDGAGSTGYFGDMASHRFAPVVVQGAVNSGAQAASATPLRTPNVFKTVQATASGNTAVWTPTSGNKFRLQRFKIMVTDNAAQTSAGVLTISFQDGSTGIPFAFDVYVPAASITAPIGTAFDSGWIDLANGYASTTASNVLNVNLSAALTAGNVRVICAGCEAVTP